MMYKNTQSIRRWRTGGLWLGLVILLGLVVLSCGPGYSETPTGDGNPGGGGTTPGGGGGTTPGGGGGTTPGGGGGTPPTPIPPTPPPGAPTLSATLIAVGKEHSCAVSSGQAFCWGNDGAGRLGDGTTVTAGVSSTADQDKPAEVWDVNATTSSTLVGVDMISAGGEHSCALRSTQAFCWGKNDDGQLGNGAMFMSPPPSMTPITPSPQHSPVAVMDSLGQTNTLTGVTAITAGGEHTCALRYAVALCWGDDANGQLGNGFGVSVPVSTPAVVLGVRAGSTLTRVTAIAAGREHTCAVYSTPAFPAPSPGLTPILAQDRQAACWGDASNGKLGAGFSGSFAVGKPVVLFNTGTNASGGAVNIPFTEVTAITAGGEHSCALQGSGGQAFCWGGDGAGQLGNGATITINQTEPEAVLGVGGVMGSTLTGVTAITAGEEHTCALKGGQALCWGKNDNGQLGNGAMFMSPPPSMTPITPSPQHHPVAVLAIPGIAGNLMGVGSLGIAAGEAHTCVLQAGRALCWGGDGEGRLGNGMVITSDQSQPGAVLK